MQDESVGNFPTKLLMKNSSWKKLQNIKKLSKALNKSSSGILNTINVIPRNDSTRHFSYLSPKRTLERNTLITHDNTNSNNEIIYQMSEDKQSNLLNSNLFIDSNERYKKKFDNLARLYDKKCNDLDSLTIELNHKTTQIIDLNLTINKITEQLMQSGYKQALVSTKLKDKLIEDLKNVIFTYYI